MRALPVLCAAAALCAIPLRADADASRAWAAARDNLPANATMVIGADLTAITGSSLFNMLMPLALSQQGDVKRGLELIRTSCKLDPFTAVQGVVIGTDADQKQGAAYLQLGAVDQPKLMKCLEEIARASGVKDAKLTVKKTGAITEIALDKDKAYLSWIGADVLVVALDIRDKAQLEKWTGQKGALGRSALGKSLARVNTKGALWGASSVGKQLDAGIKMTGGHGALTMAGGTLGLDLHVALDSAKAATDAVAKATAQLAQVTAGPMPANVKAMLKQVTVKAAGAEIAITASVPESELLGLVGAMFGP